MSSLGRVEEERMRGIVVNCQGSARLHIEDRGPYYTYTVIYPKPYSN